jgi:hypothetical protein
MKFKSNSFKQKFYNRQFFCKNKLKLICFLQKYDYTKNTQSLYFNLKRILYKITFKITQF